MKKKHLYTTIIFLSFLAVGIQPTLGEILVPSETTTEVNGTTITIATYSGNTYTLIQDVTETLIVQESELILDGAGHTVTGPGPSNIGAGVDISAHNGITVRNLNITGFSIGINISGTNPGPENIKKNTVENNTISGCTTWGIRLYLANDTILRENNISNNSDTCWGILIDTSGNSNNLQLGNTLTGNTVTGNGGGIWLKNSSRFNSLEGNIVTGHAASGIYLSVQSSNNNLTNNTSSSNRDGIKLNNSSSNTLTGNTANANSIAGISLMGTNGSNLNTVTGNTTSNNVYGIQLTNSSDNILTGNTTDGNSDTGIWLDPSNNNTITENDISNNARGIYILNSDYNTIYNNNFIDNVPKQAEVSGGSGNDFDGNYWSDWDQDVATYYEFPGGEDGSPWAEEDGWLLPDTTPPEISCPGDTTIQAMAPDGVPIEDDRIQAFLAGASATDNCDLPEDIIITNNAPAIFPPGDTVVTFTAKDKSDNSSTCQSTVTVVEAAESSLRIIPSIINRDGILQKILAVIRFPAGTTEEDIDISQPLILYPADSPNGIEAINQRIVTWYSCGTLRVSVFASFSKDEVTAGVPANGPAELMVIGRFESGQYFYGFDNVWIISWDW